MNMKVTKKLLLIEFRRVFKSKLFYISLMIGIILVTGAFINEAVPHMIFYMRLTEVLHHILFLYLIHGLETGWDMSHLLRHIYMCVFYWHRYHIVIHFQKITRISTYCSIIAELTKIKYIWQSLLRHMLQVE